LLTAGSSVARIAGNPDDPIKKEEAATDHDGMSVADRRMSDKVAEMAITVAHGVNEWDTKTIVSVSLGRPVGL